MQQLPIAAAPILRWSLSPSPCLDHLPGLAGAACGTGDTIPGMTGSQRGSGTARAMMAIVMGMGRPSGMGHPSPSGGCSSWQSDLGARWTRFVGEEAGAAQSLYLLSCSHACCQGHCSPGPLLHSTHASAEKGLPCTAYMAPPAETCRCAVPYNRCVPPDAGHRMSTGAHTTTALQAGPALAPRQGKPMQGTTVHHHHHQRMDSACPSLLHVYSFRASSQLAGCPSSCAGSVVSSRRSNGIKTTFWKCRMSSTPRASGS